MSDRLEKNARTVSLLTGVSRVTGLARDSVLSRLFGAGTLMDAFFFAFLIPNLFRRLFGEGALSAAFLPAYSRLNQEDPHVARQLAAITIAALIVVLGGLVIIGEFILFLVSHYQGHESPTVWLLMLLIPYMPMVCTVAILGAMLHVHGRFGPTAAAPILLNGCMITAALAVGLSLDQSEMNMRLVTIGAIAGAVLVAGILQIAWSLWALYPYVKNKSWLSDSYEQATAAFGDVLRKALPMVLGLGVLQLNVFIDGLIASYPTTIGPTLFGLNYPLAEGSMADLSFAQRLYQLPLGVFGLAIATAIFPLLAKQSNNPKTFNATIRSGIRLSLFVALPAGAGLILVAQPLAATLFQGARFTAEDSSRVAFVLVGYASAIWAYSLVHVLTRAFYARGKVMTPVKVALWIVGLNFLGNILLIWTPLRVSGLAWSTAFCSVLQAAILLRLLSHQTGNIIDKQVCVSWFKSILTTIVMAVVVWLVSLGVGTTTAVWADALLELVVLVAAGVTAAFAAAVIFKQPELWWFLRGQRSGASSSINQQ